MPAQAVIDPAPELLVRHLGLSGYLPTWRAMQQFTAERGEADPDEIWLLEHPPVFTQGQAGRAEHVLMPGDIPVIQVDRGGQVTYHGPGQLVAYLMVDIGRRGLGVREFVDCIEQALIGLLAEYRLEAHARRDAPGVYVGDCKIASLGLRVRRGRSFHGLALNVDMDLEPFQRINPCGYAGLRMTQLSEFRPGVRVDEVAGPLLRQLAKGLGYTRTEEFGSSQGPESND